MADAQRPLRILVDRRPTTMRVRGESGTGSYHPNVVLCVDADSGHMFTPNVVRPDDGDEAISAAAIAAREEIEEGAPGSRIIWIARQESVARAMAACVRTPDLVLESGENFGPWNDGYAAMDRDLGGSAGMFPYLWRANVSADEIAELYEEATRFYRLRPWQFLADSELVEKQSPVSGGPPLLISVMGASGVSRGLALFDSGRHFDDMMCDRGHDGVVYASFERREKMPHTVVAEADDHGWTVASRSAFPMVVRVHEERPAPCTSDDLRRVTAAFRALNEVTSAYRESRRRPRRR